MGAFDWGLELVLILLLALTLLHALRLERALAALRRDRSALGDAVAGFDQSARAAEQGMGKLHSMTSEAAQQVARKIEVAAALKDDLSFLAERGAHLADRLEAAVRAGRAMEGLRGAPAAGAAPRTAAQGAAPGGAPGTPPGARARSSAERNLLQALRGAR